MSVIATICARAGSVGVPGKNIKELNGKPLIYYSIEQAKKCKFIDNIYVSTDSELIANIAKAANVEVPFLRPESLADNETSKLTVIQHLVSYVERQSKEIDVIIDLDVTSPLREVEDIQNCFNMLTPDVDMVITGYLSNKNPYFNMVEVNDTGFVTLSKKNQGYFGSRQSAPKVYAMNASIYVWRRHALDKPLWENNRMKLYEMPEERSVDIDTPLDWKLVELLMDEKQL